MTRLLRILDTGLKPARWNVAMTAALVDLHSRGASAETVRFHRYPACVLLGKSQDVEQAADVAYCRRTGIEIARRVTGGGAVFMSPRMLAWDVVIDRRAWGCDLSEATRSICGGVAAGLRRLGVAARYRPPNDIEIGGRKVSGSSGYCEGRSAVLQGTVLIEDEVTVMARALRLPQAQVRERLTCVADALGSVPSMPSILEAATLGLADALGCELVHDRVSDEESALCDALFDDEIGTDAFVAGRSAVPAARAST